MIEYIYALIGFIGGTIGGIFLGFIILGRWFQKELLGHGDWNYSPRRLVDEVKFKMRNKEI